MAAWFTTTANFFHYLWCLIPNIWIPVRVFWYYRIITLVKLCLDASHLHISPEASFCCIPCITGIWVNFHLNCFNYWQTWKFLNYRPDLNPSEYTGKIHVGYTGYPEKANIKLRMGCDVRIWTHQQSIFQMTSMLDSTLKHKQEVSMARS